MRTPATGTTQIIYRERGPEGIDAIRALWEGLRDQRAAFPEWPFGVLRARLGFVPRTVQMEHRGERG